MIACAGMQPAVQYLAGELRVEAGQVLPVLATHNTVRLRFDIEEAEYLHLAKPDAAFPANHFSMLADTHRNQARHPKVSYIFEIHITEVSTLSSPSKRD